MIPFTLFSLSEIEAARWLESPLVRVGDVALTGLVIIKVLVWIASVIVANILIRNLLLRRVLDRTHFDPGLRFAITKIFGYTFLTLGFCVALTANGVNLSSLTVVAGALGIGIGFGLQNLVGNFVSGLVLLAERPIAVGDRIEVGGVAGNVTRMSLRSTIVVTNDNISIIVPNSELTSHLITNWSHGDPRIRVRIPVGVAYGTDIEKLQTTLLAVAAENPHVLTKPEATVFMIDFGESSINFELAVWTKELTHSPRRFRSDLNFAIERKLREAKIEIPFPQRVVHWTPPGVDAANGKESIRSLGTPVGSEKPPLASEG